MIPFLFDPTWLLILPALALAIWAQFRVKNTYAKYSQVASRSGMTGAQAARRILDSQGLLNVQVEEVAGALTDHYDPRDRTVHLSQGVFESNSLAALAVAAHETGHAVQDQVGYAPMNIRARLVPVAGFGSALAFPMFFIGFIIHKASFTWMMDLGIALFGVAVLFHVVTLPVEFDASRRAMAILANGGYLAPDEVTEAKKVLKAAAWTYVAAASMAVLQLVRLLILRDSRNYAAISRKKRPSKPSR
jgi:Zn-dependent membrane protease YugP